MIVTIAKQFTFDAAHRLSGLPEDHKCHRLHGHTYEVELVLSGRVDAATGFLVDYAEIADAWAPIHDLLDHRYLNDIPGLEIPSTEVLAAWIAKHVVDDDRLAVPAPYPLPLGGGLMDKNRYTATLLSHVYVKESSTTRCAVYVEDLYQDGIVRRRPWRHLSKLASGKSSLESHLDDDRARSKFVSMSHGTPCRCSVIMDEERTVEPGPNCRFLRSPDQADSPEDKASLYPYTRGGTEP